MSRTFNRNPVRAINIRPRGIPRPRIPKVGTAPRFIPDGGPLKGMSLHLWSASTLPMRVNGQTGEYRRIGEHSSQLVWFPLP